MSHLFYFVVPPDTLEEGDIILRGEEAHHAIRVARVKIGENIGFIDGQGGKWICKVINMGKDSLFAKVLNFKRFPKEGNRLCLIIGWLQRDSAVETLLTYGTEIGISEFRFFHSERSGRPVRLNEKIKKWIVQSCKIVGRPWFPEVNVYPDLSSAIKDFQGTLFVATISDDSVSVLDINVSGSCGLIVGPEGDFSENEIGIAKGAGAIPICLGPFIFRSELSGLLGSIFILAKQGYFRNFPERDF